jgi:hypothetical protein
MTSSSNGGQIRWTNLRGSGHVSFCWHAGQAESAPAVAPAPPETTAGLRRPLAGRPRGGASNVSILTGPAGPDRRMSWPKALRKVRGWLTPSVLRQRFWRGWSTSPPLWQMQQALDWVTAGRPTHNIYRHSQQTTVRSRCTCLVICVAAGGAGR